MEDFYVVLPSNSCAEIHPDNSASNFTITWENPIELEHMKEWKVALTEMSYIYTHLSVDNTYGITYYEYCNNKYNDVVTLKFDNLPNVFISNDDSHTFPKCQLEDRYLVFTHSNAFTLTFKNVEFAKSIGLKKENKSLPAGGLTGSEHILRGTKILKKAPGDIANVKYDEYHITLDEKNIFFEKSYFWENSDKMVNHISKAWANIFHVITLTAENRIEVKLKKNIDAVKFRNGFNFVLGFDQDYLKYTTTGHIAANDPQLGLGMKELFIYTSVCKPIHVGNIMAPLITVFIDTRRDYVEGASRHLGVVNPMYLPVSATSIRSIEVNVRNETGQLILFPYGSVTNVTLHFKHDP